jgi:UPF0716 protein FxsA
MTLLLVILFVVAPLVELAVIVQVAGAIGTFDTIGLLVLFSVLGAWLAKREGIGVLRRIQAALDRGELPSTEVADGGLILLAGALMIAPGFISDALAIVLLLPPTRALVRYPLLRYVARRGRLAFVTSVGGPGGGGRGRSYRRSPGDDVWDVESWEEPPGAGTARGELGGRP